ncbi:cobalamin biosynthesis protein [Gallaecimonas sp. GXIMD4217]|uniref:cobalamin biosynthesis protein n=1 Tax=Gallaecimonas sp. GXIMD4217 TaxID=3131927 RepID=UPI00311B2219
MNWPELLAPWAAWLAALLLPLTPPWQVWRQLAEGLAAKVNRPNRSPYQRRLAGILAWALLWLPFSALVWLLGALAQLDWLLGAFWLYLALSDGRQAGLRALVQALAGGQHQYAKTLLAGQLKRDTDRLSPLGLAKAGIHWQLRLLSDQLLLVTIAVLVDPALALVLRLALELGEAWHPARPGLGPFGNLAATLAAALRQLATPLVQLWLVLPLSPGALAGPGRPWLLAATGRALDCELGGPVLLAGRRQFRPRVGGRAAPSGQHLVRLNRMAALSLPLWLLVLTLARASWQWLGWQ